MKIDVLDVKFDNVTMDEALNMAETLMDRDSTGYVVTPNPEIVWMCRKDAEFKDIVNGADMVLPDGIGVIYGARILGTPLKEKVGGADFAEKLLSRMTVSGKTAFFLGAKPGVAQQAAEKLTEKYPGLKVCGTADGYFKDDDPVVEMINEKKPDLLLVCLGAPKQEKWMKKNMDRLDVRLMAGLGGSLDAYAGTVKRAPDIMIKLNLEWLYRLIKQPSRFKRMMSLPAFMFTVIWKRVRGK